MNPQPRCYRIRLFKKHREALDGNYMAVLDFSHGPGLRATEGQLDGLVQGLAWQAGARDEDTLSYHLAVHDWETDRHYCDWPAKTWLTPTP